MTRFTPEQIEHIKNDIIDRKVTDLYYEEDGDYYVIEFDNESETSVRFMADLI